MALNTAATFYLCDQYQEFSMQPQLVRVAKYAGANLNLSVAYPPSCDCNDDKQRQHFPNYVRHHDYVELRDQLTLQVLRNKRIDHHLEQKLHDEIVALNGDMEFEQICLI